MIEPLGQSSLNLEQNDDPKSSNDSVRNANAIRQLAHKTHLICWIGHMQLRNGLCNSKRIQVCT